MSRIGTLLSSWLIVSSSLKPPGLISNACQLQIVVILILENVNKLQHFEVKDVALSLGLVHFGNFLLKVSIGMLLSSWLCMLPGLT